MQPDEKQCSTCATVKPLAAFSFRKERGAYHAQCKECRKAAINALRYGTAADAYKAKERQRSKERQEYLSGWAKANRETLSARAIELARTRRAERLPSSRVYFLVCEQTGVLFTAKTKQAKLCKEGSRLRGLEALRERTKSAHDAQHLVRICAHCNASYEPVYGANRRVYCSRLCMQRAMRLACPGTHRKRARHYGVAYEPVNLIKVFQRAGWQCQLCGIATPKALRGTCEPNAPELDHIVPISKGGPHTYANVQCACRACNGAKSNTMP